MIQCDPISLNEIITKDNYDNGYRVKIITNMNHIILEKEVNEFIQNLTGEFYLQGMSKESILVCYRTALAG